MKSDIVSSQSGTAAAGQLARISSPPGYKHRDWGPVASNNKSRTVATKQTVLNVCF